jgi:ribosome-associated protein
MIIITPTISLEENEIAFDAIRSSGPGGQNVNKVSTAIQLRFDLTNSPSLPADIKERLALLAGNRLTDAGILIIEAKHYRTQEQNKFDAVQRLITLIQKAAVKPKTRKATRPTVTARAARLGDKKKRGELKRTRRYNPDDWQ